VSTKSSKVLIILLSLFVVSAVQATPTMSDCNRDVVACALSASSDAHRCFVPRASQVTELCNSHLLAIASEFQKPPVSFTDLPSAPVGAKSLPPVPGALLMVLTGFLYVSLVKDCKVWLAALAGLLWAGQAGIAAMPQLAARLSSKKHIQQKSPVNTVCLYQFENSYRLRSDIEGTEYIGLLAHLAGIPDSRMPLSLPASLSSLQAQRAFSPEQSRRRSNLDSPPNHPISARSEDKLRVLQFARLSFSFYLLQPTNCPALAAEQPFCFSPALIFAQLPRGPPEAALRKLLS